MNIFKKVGMLFKANKIVKEAEKMDGTKPGYMTTEFWITNIATIVIMYNSMFHKNIDPKTAAIIMGGLVATYTAGRSLVKAIKDAIAQYKGTPIITPAAAVTVITPPPAA